MKKKIYLISSLLCFLLSAGTYTNVYAEGTGSADTETEVSFYEAYEQKDERGDEETTENTESKTREDPGEKIAEKEGAAESKSLPQTGEHRNEAGTGLVLGGGLLAGILLKKQK